ncbi:hypothetical protein ACSFA0_22410 [Variovorax sp. LT1P1]|uniref:hypothetical protein n=1 Tax=Variovorax sp. LT1P1 TaxID=3443730 RepID=UPI003F44FFC6
MPATIAYGRRDGVLIFVGDLDETRDRGSLCRCTCPECGRPLQAHLGQRNAWHFHHRADDVDCNPQPMSLLHAFVRDQLALRSELVIPSVEVGFSVPANGIEVQSTVLAPSATYQFTAAHPELRGDGVQPDVVFDVAGGTRLALEVRFTHAVDEAKRVRMMTQYDAAAELDISDLPASGISAEEVARILLEPGRWSWLVNWPLRGMMSAEALRIGWTRTVWRPGRPDSNPAKVRSANQKLKAAATRMEWAQNALSELRKRALTPEKSAAWLGMQDKVDRVAIACAAMRLNPEELPAFLQQDLVRPKPMRALQHHPYSWQPPVFMKFGLGRRAFTSIEAGSWCLQAMPDRCENDDGSNRSVNGFTLTAAALHLYFMQLEEQGLMYSNNDSEPEDRLWTPAFKRRDDLAEFLELAAAKSKPVDHQSALTRLSALAKELAAKAGRPTEV